MTLGLGRTAWAPLPPGHCRKPRPLEGTGRFPQRPHVAASRATAGGLPIFPNLLPSEREKRAYLVSGTFKKGRPREGNDGLPANVHSEGSMFARPSRGFGSCLLHTPSLRLWLGEAVQAVGEPPRAL